MSENNNKMTSIARRINFDFWLKQFANFLMIDVVLVVLIAVTFFVWRENALPEGVVVDDRYFTGNEFRQIQYIIETEAGKVYGYYIYKVFDLVRVPAIVFLLIQGATLIGELFNTKKVRMRMRPLNDIAMKTEQLSNMAFDSEKFENFEQAISNLNPEMPDAKVHTGDQDLQSLEIAINNLLARMRESHRQQDRFVSDASHELRTPISVIQGYVNMLDRWGKEDEQILDESIEAIKNESENMKNLIEQLLFLAQRCSQFRLLQGLMLKVGAYCAVKGNNLTQSDMENIVRTGVAEKMPGCREILGEVARRLNLRPEDVLGAKRRPDLVLARQVSMYICRRKLGLSYPELGRAFGGRDHSTVIYAINKIKKLMVSNKSVHQLVTEIEMKTA